MARTRAGCWIPPVGVVGGLSAALVAFGCAATPEPVTAATPPASAAAAPRAPAPPPPLRPLSAEDEQLRADLHSECSALTELGPRSLVHSWNLHSATDHLARKLEVLGYEVVRQGFPVGDEVLQNLEVFVPGARTSETLVIAAHYDTTAESPGANASASGAIVLLELAKQLVGKHYARGLRLVWLSNESGGEGLTGSAVYTARTERERRPVVATLTLGSLGNYSLEHGSQRYPAELLFGSERRTSFGNFLGVLSNAGSNPLLEQVRPALSAASLPIEELVLPEGAPLAADGPQARFWNAGLAGLLLTDTAQFRSPFPEGPGDTLDRVDFDRLTRVTRLLKTLVESLADEAGEAPPGLPDSLPPAASTPGDFLPTLPPLKPPG
jgi:aminopeptidase YwaD